MNYVTAGVNPVTVETTSHSGFDTQTWADRLLNKIIHVADTAPREIREQAIAFREAIRPAIVYYMDQAVNSDRATTAAKLSNAGHDDMAEFIRRI